MASRKRRHFPESFKRRAVERATTSGLPICRVAEELGVHETVLRRWMARHYRKENRQFREAFTASPSKREPIREWALRRAARPPAPSLGETRAWAETLLAEQIDAAGMAYAGHFARAAAHLARLFPEAGPAERHAVLAARPH